MTTRTTDLKPHGTPPTDPADTVDDQERGATRLFLLVVAAAVVTTTLTGTMVNVLLPVMRDRFDASAAQAGWIITGYGLAYAVGVPLYGRLSDLYGVRRVFVLGLLGFIAGGLICAVAPNLLLLVAGRTLQGIGGAVVPSLAGVAVAKVIPAGQRGAALGVTASSVGVGSSAGPILGGAVGDLLGWRALFLLSVTLMLLVLPFARRVLPDERSTEDRHLDLAGGVLLGLSAGLFLFGITQGQVAGFGSPASWGCFLGAALAATGFVRRMNGSPHPFVPPVLFRNRAYIAAIITGFFMTLANLTAVLFVPLVLVEVNDLSTTAAGLVLTPGSLAVALISPYAGRLSDRAGVRPLLVTGLLLMTAALLYFSVVAGAAPLLIALGVTVLGTATALLSSPLNNAAAAVLPERLVGVGMGLFSGAFFLGASTGPALFGALLSAREGSGDGALNPLHAWDAAPYSDTFLLLTIAPLLALIATLGLRRGTRPDAQLQPDTAGEAAATDTAAA